MSPSANQSIFRDPHGVDPSIVHHVDEIVGNEGAVLLADDREFGAHLHGGRVHASIDSFAGASGWTLEQHGACRGDICVPRGMIAAAIDGPAATPIDVVALAELLEIPVAGWTSPELTAVALGHSASDRGSTMSSDLAPGFSLPTLEGELVEVPGADEVAAVGTRNRKRLLLAFASW